jgi:hypothetical protein
MSNILADLIVMAMLGCCLLAMGLASIDEGPGAQADNDTGRRRLPWTDENDTDREDQLCGCDCRRRRRQRRLRLTEDNDMECQLDPVFILLAVAGLVALMMLLVGSLIPQAGTPVMPACTCQMPQYQQQYQPPPACSA